MTKNGWTTPNTHLNFCLRVIHVFITCCYESSVVHKQIHMKNDIWTTINKRSTNAGSNIKKELSPCEQSEQGGSKFNWKIKSAYPRIWCQRICLSVCVCLPVCLLCIPTSFWVLHAPKSLSNFFFQPFSSFVVHFTPFSVISQLKST